jgi:hypothetical protein
VIAISCVEDILQPTWSLEIDEYVPLRCRSYLGTIGVIYLRFGDFSTSLLELLLDPASLVVRGITLTAFNTVHEPLFLRKLPIKSGLPVLSFSEKIVSQGPVGAKRIDINKTFSVGIGKDFLEIDLGFLSTADRVIKSGPIEIYAKNKSLVGLHVLGLSLEQIKKLEVHQRSMV